MKMTVELDIIIVVDLEATCWVGPPPTGQESEIIEIGICLVDAKMGKRIENSKRSIIVKPEKSTLSNFCIDLTRITQEEVDQGISLAEACEILRTEYKSKQRTWASWGDYDQWKLEEECKKKKIEYPFGESYLNIKNRFALDKGLNKEVELEAAMQIVCCPFEGRIHSGVDDAHNAAFILAELITKARD